MTIDIVSKDQQSKMCSVPERGGEVERRRTARDLPGVRTDDDADLLPLRGSYVEG